MAMNPMLLMQLKSKLGAFNHRHPKLKLFCADAFGKLDTGDVLEIAVTKQDGSRIRTNIRITEEDTQLFQDLTSMISQG